MDAGALRPLACKRNFRSKPSSKKNKLQFALELNLLLLNAPLRQSTDTSPAMADIEEDASMDASSGAAGGAAASGKRFEVKKWNAVRNQAMLLLPLRPAPALLPLSARRLPKAPGRRSAPLPAIAQGGMSATLLRRTVGSFPRVGRARVPSAACFAALALRLARRHFRAISAAGPQQTERGRTVVIWL
jgi:hypothetical protein